MNHVQIEVTNKCNFQCEFCEIKNHRVKDELPIQTVYDILDQLKTANLPGGKVYMVSFNGVGEPLLYKDLVKAVAYAKQYFPFVGFITNGYLLTHDISDRLLELNISYLTVSINAVDGEVYKHFQGYNLSDPERIMNAVIENLKYFLKRKKELNKKTEVRIPFLLTDASREHMRDFVKYWRNTGYEVLIQITRLISFKKPTNAKFTRCERITEDFMIFSNGDITCCACDQLRNCILGNIYKERIVDVMNGDKYMKIVQANDEGRFMDLPEVCRICEKLQDEGFLKNYSLGYKVIFVNNLFKNIKWKFYSVGIQVFTELKKHNLTYPFFRKVKNFMYKLETKGR